MIWSECGTRSGSARGGAARTNTDGSGPSARRCKPTTATARTSPAIARMMALVRRSCSESPDGSAGCAGQAFGQERRDALDGVRGAHGFAPSRGQLLAEGMVGNQTFERRAPFFWRAGQQAVALVFDD